MKKYIIYTLLVVSGLLSFHTIQPVMAASANIPFAQGDVWNGWYDCSEGKTKLKFTIVEVSNNSRTNQTVRAIYDFTTLKGVNGSFNTKGKYRSMNRAAIFAPVSWIKRPSGYDSPKFQGVVNQNGNEFTGKILYRGCNEFNLTLQQNPKSVTEEDTKSQSQNIEQKKQILPVQSPSPSTLRNINASYRFEQNREPSLGSYSINMHFETQRDIALVANNIDEIVKSDLMNRAKQSGSKGRIQGQYNFFVNGKEIEWRRYKYTNNKGWEPVIGIALEVMKKSRGSNKNFRPKESFRYSIINQAARLANSPDELSALFNLGYTEKGSIPINYKFIVVRIKPSSYEKWYNNKKYITKGVSYTLEVEVDDFNSLIKDRNELVKYAKLDLQNRVGNEQYDRISASYWFKADPSNKRYININLNKRAGGGLMVRSPLSLLDLLASSSEEEFTRRYKTSKAMFIAQQNGNKGATEKLQQQGYAKADLEKYTALNGVIDSLADDISLPSIYTLEVYKWLNVGGLSAREIARKLNKIKPYPLKEPWSQRQLNDAKREISELLNNLDKQRLELQASAPKIRKGSYSVVSLAAVEQKRIAEQVLYPGISKIIIRTMDLLSRIPRSVKGIRYAAETNKWLKVKFRGLSSDWRKLIVDTENKRETHERLIELCTSLTTDRQVGLDPKTGLCLFFINDTATYLLETWKLQYSQSVDGLLAEKMQKNPSNYLSEFCFAFNCRWQDFANGLTKSNYMPPNSNSNCLYEKCNSKLAASYIVESSVSLEDKEKRKNRLHNALLKTIANARPPKFLPTKNASSLIVDSFTTYGLNHESEFMAIYLGDFENSRMVNREVEVGGLFDQYLKAYGKFCKSYLPANKVPITYSVCSENTVTKNGFGMTLSTRCSRKQQVSTGIYADPVLYKTLRELQNENSSNYLLKTFNSLARSSSRIDPLFRTDPIKQQFIILNSIIDQDSLVKDDMAKLVQTNGCDNAGLKRFESNLYRYINKQEPLLLPKRNTLISTKVVDPNEFDSDKINFSSLIEDLIRENAKNWTVNSYRTNSVSNVYIDGKNSNGSPRAVSANYESVDSNSKSLRSVSLHFLDGVPSCIYYSDAEYACRLPSRKIINDYERGRYLF